MQLPESNITVGLGKGITEKSFGIGNVSLVIQILRDKMYSNPIAAIAREISCNARDAHREVGKENEPICVHIPTLMDQNFKIKDFGPGISPSRMYDVFIYYADSTKRDDNNQTGGWGLGSKTPFAYSDQFSIITVTEENGTKTKRAYIAYIDETQAGKMRLVQEEQTEDSCGTEIVVPIKRGDAQHFATAIVDATEFWDVKPIFTGDISLLPKYKNRNNPIKGTNWELYYNNYNDYNAYRGASAIIDGIAYPIDRYSFGNLNPNDSTLLSHNICLYYKVGDIVPIPSRERLQNDTRTQEKIQESLKVLRREFSDRLQKDIESKESYSEACFTYTEVLSKMSFAIAKGFVPFWKGIKLPNDGLLFKLPSKSANNSTCKIYKYMYKRGRIQPYYLSKEQVSRVRVINPEHQKFLIHDDGKKIKSAKVKKMLTDYDNSVVYVISFDMPINDGIDALKNSAEDPFDLSLVNPILMSSIPDEAKQRKQNSGPREKRPATLLKVDGETKIRNYRNELGSLESFEIDKNEIKDLDGPYVILHDKQLISGGRVFSVQDLIFISDMLDTTIFVVKKQQEKYAKDCVSLLDAMKDYAEDLKSSSEFDINYNSGISNICARSQFDWLYNMKKLSKEIEKLDSDSIFRKYLELSESILESHDLEVKKVRFLTLLNGRLDIDENKSKKFIDLKSLHDSVNKTYPMLKIIDHYKIKYHGYDGHLLNDVINYISLVDTSKKENANVN